MSKFCHKCGSKLRDEVAYCAICGEKQVLITESAQASLGSVESMRPFMPTEDTGAVGAAGATEVTDIAWQPDSIANRGETTTILEDGAKSVAGQAQTTGENVPKGKRKIPKGLLIGISAGVAAIVLITVLAIVLCGRPYQSAVADFLDFQLDHIFQKTEQLAPSQYWDYMQENYQLTPDDISSRYIEAGSRYGSEESISYTLRAAYTKTYGADFKYSYKIAYAEKLPREQLYNVKTVLKTKYGIKKSTVKQIYELELELMIDGEKDADIENATLYAANIENSWYILNSAGYFVFDVVMAY